MAADAATKTKKQNSWASSERKAEKLEESTPDAAAELIAKGRAPVKKEFIRAAGARLPVGLTKNDDGDGDQNPEEEKNDDAASKVSAVKKSKNQQRKERQLAKKSTQNICFAVAKANDVTACPYGDTCSQNHDLEAFLAQKPPDLPGDCPFVASNQSCPYGAACRFAGTHRTTSKKKKKKSMEENPSIELNNLRKDFQLLLRKKQASFPRADANLQSLGLWEKAHKLPSEEEKTTNRAEVPENDINVPNKENEVRALKKPKLESNSTRENDFNECKITEREKKLVDFRGKLYVAPLTTVGNLPFRRVCKQLGADITCGEMAMSINLLQGHPSEWALLRRHHSEDVFGVQICGAYPDVVARTAEMIDKECEVDFIDLNIGCPIDIVVNRGAGSSLLTKPSRLQSIVKATSSSIETPLTLKVRTGYFEGKNCVHSFIGDLNQWGASALTIHGRTRQQRYSKLADWDYIYKTCDLAPEGLQVIGNGDIFSYTDWNEHMSASKLSTCMLARGVLIKPWLLTEIKEQRHWDITANERLDILKDYVRFGLEHWGSDTKGVETTRHFLLEWLSYMHRYIPVGLLEVIPQKLNWRPPLYYGRNDLESMMASDSAADWVRISEMLIGPAPASFTFTPRHKSNAYDRPENG